MSDQPANAHYEAQTARDQRRLVPFLIAAGHHHLAAMLARCSSASPCLLGACQLCGARLQNALFDLTNKTIRTPAIRDLRGRTQSITIAPAFGCVLPEDLTIELCEGVVAHLAETLVRGRFSPALGMLDLSLNRDTTGGLPLTMSAHGHVYASDWASKAQRQVLKERYPNSEFVKRPVKVQELDRKETGRLYPFKPRRVCRETYLKPADEHRKAHFVSRRRTLPAEHAVSIALIEQHMGLFGRVFSHGIPAVALKPLRDAFERARDGP